ncbi:CASP-like protein 4D1 [Bidens hawaiensis]|uniref:CASP-like protein 4D1 n=1 Tax=Bidens hawaiensis TaxID=980011 RepID=UPI00404B40AA
MSGLHYEEPKASKLPIAALTLRVTTLVTLVISMGLLRSNSVTYDRGQGRETFTFKSVQTYQYVFFGTVVGLCYTFLQVPFAMYFFFSKKRLINNRAFLAFEFYGDKVCMILLATAVGALFGATVQTNDGAQSIEFFGGSDKIYDAKDYRSEMRKYCMLANISAVFLLIGCFCSVISSVISSRALANKW